MENLFLFFKSIIDRDSMPVVVCDINHTIIYMNPCAIEKYRKQGGITLIGKSIKICHNSESCDKIDKVIDWFKASPNHNCVFTYYDSRKNKDVYMIALRDDNGNLIGYYEKHESRNEEISPKYELF